MIIIGDSFSTGYLIEKDYTRLLEEAGFSIKKYAINGLSSKIACEKFKNKVKKEKNIIFIGTNDFLMDYSVKSTFENVKEISNLKSLIVIPPLVEEECGMYVSCNRKIIEYKNIIEKNFKYFIDCSKFQNSKDFIDGVHMRESFHTSLFNEICKNKWFSVK
ncbi:MAG: G-D-S-L family lipolytic protein [Peptoniphilaceae bacterium]|nr:G-D-S-L family lipolytic protein [Peptoniphilaceae bacterium]MDD7383185.1 G-D-S-L family lipolytic protein [Peptoniphilaceae bacterium]MDY3738409.1 G-D-S-L family lipolytic protein [Peptoniphilaceae bacterium]